MAKTYAECCVLIGRLRFRANHAAPDDVTASAPDLMEEAADTIEYLVRLIDRPSHRIGGVSELP